MKNGQKLKLSPVDKLLGTYQRFTGAATEYEDNPVEGELVGPEERYRRILDSMLEGCQIIGFDWRYLYVNDAAARQGRRVREELLGRTMMEMYPGIEGTAMFASLRRCMQKRVSHRMENEFTFPDGGSGWFELRIAPVPEGVFVLSLDITERKRMEHDLSKRMRELGCLYSVANFAETPDIASSELYTRVVNMLPGVWQYPDEACARLLIADEAFRTENYRETKWKQSADIMVDSCSLGKVEVNYLEAMPEADEGPFLKEERLLLEAVADRLARITERRRMEETLRKSEASLAEAQRIARLGNWDWDIAGNAFLWSDETYRIFGLSPQRFGATYEAFINSVHPDDRGFVQKSVDEALYKDIPYDIEYRVVLPDGSVRVVHEQAVVTFGEGGKPVRMVGTVQDITERKQAEELLKTISENSPMGVYVVQDRKFKYVNRYFQESTGYSHEELTDKDPLDYVFPGDRDAVKAGAILMLKGRLFYPYEYRILNKKGEIRWVMETVTSIQYRGKRAILGNYMDVTERKLLEKKMIEYEELNRLKSDLLSTVSHELRTPLATIKGYSTMILDYYRKLKSEEKKECLQSIDKAADRLTELVDRLLDMSRLDAGLLKLYKAPANIFELIDKAVAEARLRSPGHKIVAQLKKGESVTAMVDARRIQQVLDNLLDNACKYSEEGKDVVVSARRVGRQLLISVADNGIGIPDDEVERVFDRMYRLERRLDGEERDTAPGLGLGLAICKGLVEAHGGRIWMASKEGKGSKCSFTLQI